MKTITEADVQRMVRQQGRKPMASEAKPRPHRVTLRRLEARLLDLDGFDTLEDVRDFLHTAKRGG